MKKILDFKSIVKNILLILISSGILSLVLLAALSVISFMLGHGVIFPSMETIQKFLLKNLGIILFLMAIWILILSIQHPETLEKYKIIYNKK